ncbi:hypothetical protein WJX84_007243 [Apatococcus fuscideae]|uniref:phosphopantothenoylcysteine decarboxylase n=1 Tax=Apatococcus fuscideae TaxID=2026836 RepID=A0AAW1TFK8_9CHLO
MERVRRPRVLLGVTGSVAAIKAPDLARMLASFADVRVVATGPALRFFNSQQLPLNCRTIHGDEDEWRQWHGKGDPIMHIELRKWADVLIVAPLSANSLAKAAQGLCDNLLTCILRAWDFSKPCLVAPAMNTAMWEHPLTVQQLRTLKGFGYLVIDPVSKQLACGDVGFGAMESPEAIADTVGRSAHEYLMSHQRRVDNGRPAVSSIVDAFQRSVPLHMQQRPSIGAPGIRPFAAAYPPPHGSIAPLKHVGSDRPNTAFSNGELSSGDFGDFGHGPPAMFNAAPPPPANPFVKAVSSEFGVGEISSKRARHGS